MTVSDTRARQIHFLPTPRRRRVSKPPTRRLYKPPNSISGIHISNRLGSRLATQVKMAAKPIEIHSNRELLLLVFVQEFEFF
jgi:hypothetical protein